MSDTHEDVDIQPKLDQRVVLVHNYLLVMRGAERTFSAIVELYPRAPIFTLLYDEQGTARDWTWLWFSLIGWFLVGSATAEAQQAVLAGCAASGPARS